jgi:hypothetical protein
MTTDTREMLAELNRLREEGGKSPIKRWGKSHNELEAALCAARDAAEFRQPVDEPALPPAEDPEPPYVAEDPEVIDDPESESAVPSAKPVRGAIMSMSIDLLTTTDEPYGECVRRIKEALPGARTTARSLASVAMDLRREGIPVPDRRRPVGAVKVLANRLACTDAGFYI